MIDRIARIAHRRVSAFGWDVNDCQQHAELTLLLQPSLRYKPVPYLTTALVRSIYRAARGEMPDSIVVDVAAPVDDSVEAADLVSSAPSGASDYLWCRGILELNRLKTIAYMGWSERHYARAREEAESWLKRQ